MLVTHRVYYHGTEYRRSDFAAVFGVFVAAHHAVVSGCEHAPDHTQYHYGEEGDDDTISQDLSFHGPVVLTVDLYHVHALKADTTGFMTAVFRRLSGAGSE